MTVYVVKGYPDYLHPSEFYIISIWKDEQKAEEEKKEVEKKYYDVSIEDCYIKDI